MSPTLTLLACLTWMAGSLSPEVIHVEGIPPHRVQLSVSVLDEAGRPVTGLTADDFVVTEDGRRQTVVDFGRESARQDRPLSVVFLVDRSGSIGRQMSKWRQACVALATGLRPIDEVRLATFAGDLTVVQDFTSDPNMIASAAAQFGMGSGGTDIYRSVAESLHDLRDRPGRKAIFLLTDGLDSLRPDAWSTSMNVYLNGLVMQAVAFQTTIVTILPGPSSEPTLPVQDMAVRTGGWWLYSTDDLPALAGRLGTRLLESYYIAYDSLSESEVWHGRKVEVAMARADRSQLQVRTVAGVFGKTPLLDSLKGDITGDDEEERVRAAMALATLPEPRAAGFLIKALKDDSPRVRQAAAASLQTLGPRLDDPKWRMKVLEALEAFQERESRGSR